MGLFSEVFQRLDKAVQTSAKQALNKAANSTRSKYAKDLVKTLGMKSTEAKKRAKIYRATNANFGIVLSIGTRENLIAHNFAPKKVKVMSSKGLRIGSNYLIKSQGRQIAPAGVIGKGKNSGKPIIVTRIGNTDTFKTVKIPKVFQDTVAGMKSGLEAHLVESFSKTFDSQLDFNLKK